MISHQNVFETARHTVHEFTAHHRIAGLVVVVIVALFGAAQWVYSSRGEVPVAAGQATDVPKVDYFPAQYVNQATQPEKHIEGF